MTIGHKGLIMSNLFIIHLVDSRKSRVEMQEYINKAFNESEKLKHLPNKITNCFAFGGRPWFNVDDSGLEIPKGCTWVCEVEDFKCSLAIRRYIARSLDMIKKSEWKSTYFNIRDMDDEYDTEMMVRDLPHEDDNVGIVRYNYKVDGKESTYGRFNGDYFIKSWFEIGPSRVEHPKDVFEAIVHEPHMIHRPFALFRSDVLDNYHKEYIFSAINKAEDFQIMLATYLICLDELHLGIKVCGTVSIANYIRSQGQMSQGDCDWIAREREFTFNILDSVTEVLSMKVDTQERYVMRSALARVAQAERDIGNTYSMLYHLRKEGKLNDI